MVKKIVCIGVILVSVLAQALSPTIVARSSFLNQTASFGPTTILTPTATGDYVVRLYGNIDSCTGGQQISVSVNFTDDAGFSETPGMTLDCDPSAHAETSAPFMARFVNASNVTMTATDTPGVRYSVYFEIEKLF